MFIDTHSRETMMYGICNYFNLTIKELSLLFEKARKESQKEYYFDGDIFNDIINNFIDVKMPNIPINEILFFHLSRRLDSTSSDYIGKNLYELLTTENEVSIFLKNHDVEFTPIDKHLELVYKGKKVSLTDSFRDNVPYLRWRLGYNENRIDYCFNGFMLKDLLYKNNYARDLYKIPEFIGILSSFLKRADIVENYYINSKYYCFEYCLPLEKVLFDDDENLSFKEKQKYLLNRIFHRLYEYYVSEPRYMFDHDNPIIRLRDDDTMDAEYFISIEEITRDMIWR